MTAFLGVDVGTSSTKGVLVDGAGRILAQAQREHRVSRPAQGHVEMDAEIWWDQFVSIAEELTADPDLTVSAIGVSGMGPCVLLTDDAGTPLRPAILYGVDMRAEAQIRSQEERFGGAEILQRTGSALTTQAVGPKLQWVAEHEPEVWRAARRLFMVNLFLVWRLTGHYGLDFHSASQCNPLFDIEAGGWYRPWSDAIAPDIVLPELTWPADVAGSTTAGIGGIPAGTPVVMGTIDAWSEAVSVGAVQPGDLMLMYGTTMFLIATVDRPIRTPSMWGTIGALPGTRNLAGGLATSGAITDWLRELFGGPGFDSLLAEAGASGPGAGGLLMLPYFAGERTPIMDPSARGTIAGLTVSHTRGDLYRAALEATAFAVRHNIETMREAGAALRRIVAAGGGVRGDLWPQILSAVTGLTQEICEKTVGASYGAAWLAASTRGSAAISEWNPVVSVMAPDPARSRLYDELYPLYRGLYTSTAEMTHALVRIQARARSQGES